MTRVSPTHCAMFAAVLLLTGICGISALPQQATYKPAVHSATRFDISRPLRSMKIRRGRGPSDDDERRPDDRGAIPFDKGYDPDPVVQRFFGDGLFSARTELAPSVTTQFAGLFNPPGTTGPIPPDTVGDVGTSHYIQMVNSRFQIFNKSGTSVFGPADINTLWTGFGGACETENSGDPVVLHDQFADRWLLTQFTSAGPNYFNCVALSQTNDPTGAYYRWAFPTGTNFPDYPKLGIWRDGYYIANREFLQPANTFAGEGLYALNRDQMLLGNASPQTVSFLVTPTPTYLPGDGLQPADIDGNTLPPVGTPEYFVGSMDAGGPYGAPADALNLFKMSVNWTTPALSTLSAATQLNIAAFDTVFPCSGGTDSARSCIPQPGTTSKVDVLSYRQRPLHRLAYRNLGTHESLVTTQSVEATAGVAGMRWWEIRSPNASPVVFQEGTYSPDSVNRWMGSIAQDRKGNMLLGYNVSNATSVFPGIRYTGRLASDPLGTMPQGEGTMIAGGGSETSTSSRWGDYSSMNIDPVNDCTFWFTTEYFATTSARGWSTRIGSVTFPGCVAPTAATVSVSGRVLSGTGRPIVNAMITVVSAAGDFNRSVRTSRGGYYSLGGVAAGQSYIVTVSSRRHSFVEPARVLNLQDPVANLDFIAMER